MQNMGSGVQGSNMLVKLLVYRLAMFQAQTEPSDLSHQQPKAIGHCHSNSQSLQTMTTILHTFML